MELNSISDISILGWKMTVVICVFIFVHFSGRVSLIRQLEE